MEAEIADLSADMRARLGQVIDLIETKGFDELPRGFARHLEDKLWELRVRGRDGISRAVYVTATGKRLVIVRVFVKKTQRTPPKELRLARIRAKEIE